MKLRCSCPQSKMAASGQGEDWNSDLGLSFHCSFDVTTYLSLTSSDAGIVLLNGCGLPELTVLSCWLFLPRGQDVLSASSMPPAASSLSQAPVLTQSSCFSLHTNNSLGLERRLKVLAALPGKLNSVLSTYIRQ